MRIGEVLTMDEYIKREALIEWLKRIPLIDLSDGRGLCRVIMEDDFKKAIKKMPKGIIADVSPVRHGRWILDEKRYVIYCSECGEVSGYSLNLRDVREENHYCPNCGCKMDLEG